MTEVTYIFIKHVSLFLFAVVVCFAVICVGVVWVVIIFSNYTAHVRKTAKEGDVVVIYQNLERVAAKVIWREKDDITVKIIGKEDQYTLKINEIY
jgi:hypothetical protein